jgi:hypothetical protein
MNNREQATFILLGAFLGFMLLNRDLRGSLGGVGKSLLTPKLAIPLLIFASWTAGAVGVARTVGLWTSGLAASTVLWFLFVGMAWFINVADAGKDREFFKRRVVEAVSIGALFEFFVNLEVMALPIEIVFQMALIFVVLLDAHVHRQHELKAVARVTTGVLALFTAGLTIYSVQRLIDDWHKLALQDVVNQLVLPVWLTIAAVPCVYLIALYAGYESLLINLHFWNDRCRPPVRVVAGIVAELRASLIDIDEFRGISAKEAATSKSFKVARQSVRNFRRERAKGKAAQAEARERLRRYVGVPGVDSDGLTRDRREFAATKEALRWLATCHMGWYQNEDRSDTYRTDLLTVLGDFVRQGLPDNHGLVMKVRKDGQAWYAYRVTPSGHAFGIGAVGAPPSQWNYDGTRPPTSFPSAKRGWSSFMEPDRPEWREEQPTE